MTRDLLAVLLAASIGGPSLLAQEAETTVDFSAPVKDGLVRQVQRTYRSSFPLSGKLRCFQQIDETFVQTELADHAGIERAYERSHRTSGVAGADKDDPLGPPPPVVKKTPLHGLRIRGSWSNGAFTLKTRVDGGWRVASDDVAAMFLPGWLRRPIAPFLCGRHQVGESWTVDSDLGGVFHWGARSGERRVPFELRFERVIERGGARCAEIHIKLDAPDPERPGTIKAEGRCFYSLSDRAVVELDLAGKAGKMDEYPDAFRVKASARVVSRKM